MSRFTLELAGGRLCADALPRARGAKPAPMFRPHTAGLRPIVFFWRMLGSGRAVGTALAAAGVLALSGCSTETIPPPKPKVIGIPAKTTSDVVTPSTSTTAQPASAPKAETTPTDKPVDSVKNPSPPPEPVAAKPAPPAEVVSKEPEPVSAPVVPAQEKRAVIPPAMVLASPSLPPEESSGGHFWLWFFGLVGIGTSFVVAYTSSETARVRRQVRETLTAFESVPQAQRDLLAKLRSAAEAAAGGYAAGIRRGYLQQVPIDEIRRVTPGVRLQPLKDQGVGNLLACQGWTAGKLQQLRGIGPESAYRIAQAIEALTKSVNKQAVPHPLPNSSGPAEKLYRSIYVLRDVSTKFAESLPGLEAMGKGLRPQALSVIERTSFFNWLIGSQKQGELHAALEAGRILAGKTKLAEKEGAALAQAREHLATARKLDEGNIAAAVWIMDAEQVPDYYGEAMVRLLGENSAPRRRVAPAVSISATPSEVAMPVREPLPEPARVKEETPRIETMRRETVQAPVPAVEPIALRTAAVGIEREFKISIRIGDMVLDSSSAKLTGRAADCWVPQGQSKQVGGITLEGGMFYCGKNLPSVSGRAVEPALIDPSLPVSVREADCRTRMLDYWSNYTYASPAARASYLQWLHTGRQDPEADIGYVFLYFYGLERRVLADAKTDAAAKAEIPAIIAEVQRLRSIYAKRSSFDRYSAEFVDYLEGVRAESAGWVGEDTLPSLQRYHVSFALKRKLGWFADEKRPLPAEWAFTWYHNDPRTRLPAAGLRCPEHFATLFKQEYAERFGEGLTVAAGKTRLHLAYRPASASFNETLVQPLDLPDVSLMTASYTKLEAIAMGCYAQLDAYSRFVGKSGEARNSYEGMVLLPVCLWPAEKRNAIEELRARMESYPVCTLREFLAPWGAKDEVPRATYLGLCRSLEGAGLGLEPNPRFGTEVPDLDEIVAVFPGSPEDQASSGFGLAALLLRLASTVAASDGDFSEPEAQKLRGEIEANRDLSKGEKHRLLARMAIYRRQPPPLTGLKPAIAGRSQEERQRVTDFLISMIFADGAVAAGEVKVMEKIYTLFGLDSAILYTRLHALSAGDTPAPATRKQITGPMKLDAAKVRQLREASEEVTTKLAAIFNADLPPAEQVPEIEVDPMGTDPAATLLFLDEAHAGLLMLLTGRPQWSRAEFEEICSDKGLMPDGAIERINEAAFAKFDQPVIEGDDPLEIIGHLLEEQLYAADNTTKGT